MQPFKETLLWQITSVSKNNSRRARTRPSTPVYISSFLTHKRLLFLRVISTSTYFFCESMWHMDKILFMRKFCSNYLCHIKTFSIFNTLQLIVGSHNKINNDIVKSAVSLTLFINIFRNLSNTNKEAFLREKSKQSFKSIVKKIPSWMLARSLLRE